MARHDPYTAFIVAIFRDGRMTAVRNYAEHEVDKAVFEIDAFREGGATVKITIAERADGLGVSDADRRKLTKAEGRRR